jgi:nitrite reductase/ring-hydroxylating ferredoxin subunit
MEVHTGVDERRITERVVERRSKGVRVTASGTDPERDPRREIPVLGFRDYWYPVIGERKVPKRKPLRVKLLGEQLCVFRGADGIAVVSDICPHRGASLSGGNCHYQGTVSCPYHGWTFDGAGACVAALSEGPDSIIPGRVTVRSYRTVTLKGIVFVWMGDGEPVPPSEDLPPELFDDSLVLWDATIWNANWRPALENMNDNHVFYVHRNSIQLLLQPLGKQSYSGARARIYGGGVALSHYADESVEQRPYRERFEGVNGYWPKHARRLAWAWLFRAKPLSWLWRLGDGGYPAHGAYHGDPEWDMGPHMPGMLRINGGSALYTRWCVPVDERTTCEFYLWATRPRTTAAELWERLKYPLAQKLLRNRNLGMQDGKILEETRFDTPERFTPFDVETMGWRHLAILSARYGGRHDRIPPEAIERLNRTGEGEG